MLEKRFFLKYLSRFDSVPLNSCVIRLAQPIGLCLVMKPLFKSVFFWVSKHPQFVATNFNYIPDYRIIDSECCLSSHRAWIMLQAFFSVQDASIPKLFFLT